MNKKLIAVAAGALLSVSVLGSMAVKNYHPYDLNTKIAHAENIYKELVKYTGVPGLPRPELVIVTNPMVNAWTDGETVTVTTGILELVDNDSQIAFIVGHEIGHIMLSHLSALDPADPRLKEANADKYGTYLVLRGGYDPCEGKKVWRKFKDMFGNGILTEDHPSEVDREDSLNFPMCNWG